MVLPHPIPYQGSKRQLAAQIVQYFPDDAVRLVEPFVGSGAISIYAAYHGKVSQFFLNDINQPLMELWYAILHKPNDLAHYYEQLWNMQQGRERQFYDLVRTRFNQSYRPYFLLYLLARCVKAAVRYNAKGEFNQSPDNRRKGRQPHLMYRDIKETSKLLKNSTITSEDYRRTLIFVRSSDIVYMDPPYQGVCAQGDPRYLKAIDFDEFVEALNSLNARNIRYIVSYDGRTGSQAFGKTLPSHLDLVRIEVHAGRSSQATLLGRKDHTVESLYLSPALVATLPTSISSKTLSQLPLFAEPV